MTEIFVSPCSFCGKWFLKDKLTVVLKRETPDTSSSRAYACSQCMESLEKGIEIRGEGEKWRRRS